MGVEDRELVAFVLEKPGLGVDVENIGLWAGRPYLIYTVRTGELAAWRIVDGTIEALELTANEH